MKIGLADADFIIPYTIGEYLANLGWSDRIDTDHQAFREAMQGAEDKLKRLLSINGSRTVDDLHRELGLAMWDFCGMSRNEAGLTKAKEKVREIRDAFWKDVKVTGTGNELNAELRSEEHTSELQSRENLVCRLLLEK